MKYLITLSRWVTEHHKDTYYFSENTLAANFLGVPVTKLLDHLHNCAGQTLAGWLVDEVERDHIDPERILR